MTRISLIADCELQYSLSKFFVFVLLYLYEMSASVVLVVLILGADANIGSHIARTFAAKGYKVALSSRSARDEDSTAGFLNIRGGNVGSELRPGRLHRVAAGLGGSVLSNLPTP